MDSALPWYLNPVFLTPMVGLLGVLVGGAITAASSFLIEVRRENREKARENGDRAREFKTAGRLIEEEFSHASAACTVVVKDRTWWYPATVVTSVTWQQHRASLAADLSDEDWSTFRIAAVGVERLIQFRADAVQSGKNPGDNEIRKIKEHIQPAIKKARATAAVLGFFSSDEGSNSQVGAE